MEHIEEFQTAREDLVRCQFCSWRAAERYECTCKEHRIIKQTELPIPPWCPLRVINDTYGTSDRKTH
jgi:hypothetical protein